MNTAKVEVLGQLREILTYVARFKRSTFVITIDTDALESNNDVLLLARDVSLLHAVGIRVALVIGNSTDRIVSAGQEEEQDKRLRSRVKELCKLINSIHPQQLPETETMSKNLVEELRLCLSGREQQCSFVEQTRVALDKGAIPLLAVQSKGDAAEPSFLTAILRVTCELCRALVPDKLLLLSYIGGILDQNKDLLREAHPDEVSRLIESGQVTGKSAQIAQTLLQVVTEGVSRAHLINGTVNGGLLLEVFTKDGIGTMTYLNPYQEIRSARLFDIGGILDLLAAHESQNIVRGYTERTIERQLPNYHVVVKDDIVIACGCLRCYPKQKKAFVSSLAVNPTYLTRHVGEPLLERLCAEAMRAGATLLTMVGPRTGDSWLLQRFNCGGRSDLPEELRRRYASSTPTVLVRKLTE
jgi:amino-acid N-acetyltransferase